MIRNKVRKSNFKPITAEIAENLVGELVGVHWNSHEKCWSVVNFKSRKVTLKVAGHIERLLLNNISFKVDLTKKRNALTHGAKDRHTFIVGVFAGLASEEQAHSGERLRYNVEDNENPFTKINGDNVQGVNLYFSPTASVFVV